MLATAIRRPRILDYTAKNLKNVLLAGHMGSGKTTLAEALLYYTKGTDRFGSVDDGNTVGDFDAEEIRRKASLFSSILPVESDGTKINIIDAPGLFDFELGVYEGVMAAESVIIAVSSRDGLQVGALKAYKLAKKMNKSRMFYIAKLDVDNADFYKTLEELKTEFGPSVCPVVVPHVAGDITTYIDLIDMEAFVYEGGKTKKVDMPDTGHRLEGLVAAISEAVAEADETLFEKYFSGEQFTPEEIRKGIYMGVKAGTITPVICGSATKFEAVDLTLEAIKVLLPAAADVTAAAKDKDGNEVELACDAAGPLVAYVFKTIADPFVGKLSFVKVLSGVLKQDSPAVIARTGETEKLGKLIAVKGKKQTDITQIVAGDIAAVTKCAELETGDCLCSPGKVYKIEGAVFPAPSLTMAIRVKTKGDEGKISTALARLIEEDRTLKYEVNTETVQQLISGLGEQHLDVIVAKLKAKFGVDVELSRPRVAYRETIRKKVDAEGKHKKQTGGHGQYGHVKITFEPCDAQELVFEEKVFGGSVPRNFFPAVEKGLQGAVQRGVVAGYPVVGIKATLTDGSYHPVDSSEMAFKLAAGLAYRTGLAQASPVLLEPIGTLKAYVPDDNTGDMMGEVNKRRGRVLGMQPFEDGLQEIAAECPMSELFDFTTFMRSLTQGRGFFTVEFARYEPLPQPLEAKVIEEAKKLFGNVEVEE